MTTDNEPVFKLSMSPTIGAIAAAIAKAQMEMGPAIKDRENPHYKNMYATLASCLEACKPLHAQGVAVLQPPQPAGLDGVCVVTLLAHSSGEWIKGELWMPTSKRDAQGFGSALSYARRYCLSSTVGLGTDDDDGEDAARGQTKPNARQSRAPASPAPERVADPKVFQSLCDRVDQAETVAVVNAVAVGAKKAGDERAITVEQLEIIKAAVAKKRSFLNSQSGANGATQ